MKYIMKKMNLVRFKVNNVVSITMATHGHFASLLLLMMIIVYREHPAHVPPA